MERRQLEIKTGKRRTHAKRARIFEKDILPFLGKQAIHEIKRPDLIEVISAGKPGRAEAVYLRQLERRNAG
jgi:hypothetical protein